MSKTYIDDSLELVGFHHKYQLRMCVFLLVLGFLTDMLYSGMPLMETSPIVNIVQGDNITTTLQVNYTLCNSNYNFTINKIETKSSWVNDYNIYCDKFKVSLLGFFILIGGLIGSLAIQFFRKIGPNYSFIIVCLIMSFSSLLLVSDSIYVLYIFLIINGFTGLILFILKINIMSEISHKNYRSFYNNIVISGTNISLMINYLMFNNHFNWKTTYLLNSVYILIVTYLFSKYTTESPRFFYIQNKQEETIKSLMYIARVNGREKALNFKENLDKMYSEGNKVEMVKISSTAEEQENNNPNQTYQTKSRIVFASYIISYPMINFLYFIYMLEIKEFSYFFSSVIYLFCIVSFLVSSYFFSHFMNYLGRKYSKIILISLFSILFGCSKFFTFEENVLGYIYLVNRLIMHSAAMINHTHINEFLPTNIRLKYLGYAFTLSKCVVLFAPFIYEFFQSYNTHVILSVTSLLLFTFFIQEETTGKNLQDFN